MITGSNWPREGYINEKGIPYTEQEIFDKWNRIGLNARNRGIWMHYNIENFLNDLNPNLDIPELCQFHEFYLDNILKANLQPYRTEWRIAAPDLKLAGSVDFVCQRPDKTYELIDWKRAQKLESSLTNSYGKRAKPPLHHLDDCDGTKYFLQLNLYRYILETYYGLPIAAMTVVSFHPQLDNYFAVTVPRYDREVQLMVDDLKHSASL
eukprot:CAMPEP_0170070714 /NCGR_PEP_ID=MMETSP0019_2-20121128/8901_1 /TAXON_ID=98059 /ORGANISM="Dinobryon sp., Strain UTEXLB2267" /LENGTH=207 /DNA_ID=CAMNT_0010279059 /DNA_START=233 /DNA_END=856 /DNA_ORIENTATION=-